MDNRHLHKGLGLDDFQKGDVIHGQAEKNLTEQFQKRGETGPKCNPYDVSEGPIRERPTTTSQCTTDLRLFWSSAS